METPRKVLRNRHLDNVAQFATPLKIPPSPMMENLGFGTGVNVYRFERSPRNGVNRSPWAIKKINKQIPDNCLDLYNSRLKGEADILRKLSHPNIVGFRAYKKNENGMNQLALECCEISLGDIIDALNTGGAGVEPLPAKNIFKMSLDMSKALEYLHNEAKLLHANVKSFNVLVKNDFEICKLCNFGVSLPMNENGKVDLGSSSDLKYIGTEAWSAPEVLDEENIIDGKADIFSFGLVIYECLAMVPPHTWGLKFDDESDESVLDKSLQLEQMESAFGTRPALPDDFKLSDEYNPIVELFYVCTNSSAEDRPSARDLVNNLSAENLNCGGLFKRL